ncbi:integrase [Peribacillus simplex]|uniref:integrase n=1 Tax=Peribacillus simplex TaxID=1478 RepID=UPI00366DCD55
MTISKTSRVLTYSNLRRDITLYPAQACQQLIRPQGSLERDMSATIPFGKTLGYWFYKANKDIAMLQPILLHSQPFITLRYIGITEEETSNVLKTF